MSRHKPLADEVKQVTEFQGIVNTKRVKDFGHKALTVGTNIEVTDTKKLVRRMGYTLLDAGSYTAAYGTDAQDHLYVIKGGQLLHMDADGVQTLLATGINGTIFSWGEDPNNNVYFTGNGGSNGIITNDGRYLPLSLPIPTFVDAGVVDSGTWEYRPFNLGARYTQNAMQLMATYVMADGRESPPSETITLEVTPEVKLIRCTIAPQGAFTRIYATAPGGSTYYLVSQDTRTTVTIPVARMNMTATGVAYNEALSVSGFPASASLLGFYGGVLYALAYDAADDQGVLYASLPLRYHLFDQAEDFMALSSYPLLLLPYTGGLVLGTSTNIYKFTPKHVTDTGQVAGETLTEMANYGVIPGGCGDTVEGDAYVWTRRGVARVTGDRTQFKYELMTKDHFSADPGVFNHACLFHDRGYVKLVASMIAGNRPFNVWSER
jgi:hypothetical protein